MLGRVAGGGLPNGELRVPLPLVRMEEVTDRIAAGETAAQIVERAEGRRHGLQSLGRTDVLRQPADSCSSTGRFDDVRLVAAPPSSIGKLGGDTDNWIWPRHTGDFSMFRVYASKDNQSGGLPAPERPLPSEETLQHIPRKGLKKAISR